MICKRQHPASFYVWFAKRAFFLLPSNAAGSSLNTNTAFFNPVLLSASFPLQDTLKVGFELTGDLGKLAASYPALTAFQRVESVLELRYMWVAHLQSRPGTSATVS